jgi:hypothetical protein
MFLIDLSITISGNVCRVHTWFNEGRLFSALVQGIFFALLEWFSAVRCPRASVPSPPDRFRAVCLCTERHLGADRRRSPLLPTVTYADERINYLHLE